MRELENSNMMIAEINTDQARPEDFYIVKVTSASQAAQTKIVVHQ